MANKVGGMILIELNSDSSSDSGIGFPVAGRSTSGYRGKGTNIVAGAAY